MRVGETVKFSVWKKAIVTVTGIVVVGFLMGIVSTAASQRQVGRPRQAELPAPGWALRVVWTTLYTMMGIALAVVLNAAPSAERSRGLTLFGAQLLLNFAWSPIFFGAHLIGLALIVILLTNALVTAAIVNFWRVRPLAWALLLPYLARLCLATALNYETGHLNPRANSHPLGLT